MSNRRGGIVPSDSSLSPSASARYSNAVWANGRRSLSASLGGTVAKCAGVGRSGCSGCSRFVFALDASGNERDEDPSRFGEAGRETDKGPIGAKVVCSGGADFCALNRLLRNGWLLLDAATDAAVSTDSASAETTG